MRRRILLAVCFIGALLGGAVPGAGDSLELAVKATFLYKFAQFVEWPSAALGPPSRPFAFCVSGNDPFGDLLDKVVAGQSIEGRPVVLRRMAATTRGAGCDVLFAGGPAAAVAAALDAVRGAPVLTVTDSQTQGGPRGIIDFVLVDNHVRFAIDEVSARMNGLVISSKLLSLAVEVRR